LKKTSVSIGRKVRAENREKCILSGRSVFKCGITTRFSSGGQIYKYKGEKKEKDTKKAGGKKLPSAFSKC